MTDPLSPTPLSEEERLHFTNLREAWRRAAPVYTDIAATDVEWLCTLIDRLSPGVAEPPAEEREACRTCHGQACEEGCGECHKSPSVAGPDAHRQCRSCHGTGVEPPVEVRRGCSSPYHCPCGCGAHVGCFLDDDGDICPEPPPVAEGVVLLDGKQYSLVVDWLPAVWDEAIRDYLPRHPIPVRLDIEDQPVPVLPDPQEAEAFPPDPPEEN